MLYWVEHFALNLCMCALGLWLLSFAARTLLADLRARAGGTPHGAPQAVHPPPELKTRIADAKPQFGRRAG